MDENNDFEKFPGTAEVSGEQIAKAMEWENAMESGVPEFQGESSVEGKFGVAHEGNDYYGEAVKNVGNDEEGASRATEPSANGVPESGTSATESGMNMTEPEPRNAEEPGEQYNAGITDAAALINYGLNAAARDLGVETVVQKLKGFDASGRADPIKDFFEYLGVDTPAEYKSVEEESGAAAVGEAAFRGGVNGSPERQSAEGAFKAIEDMKELIGEVEGADPRYAELRAGAKAAGKGYFEYAVSSFGTQGLVELFQVLASQREKADEKAVEKVAAPEVQNDEVERREV